MNWWGWIIAGAILLGAELSFVNAQFYLVFIGSAAMKALWSNTLLIPRGARASPGQTGVRNRTSLIFAISGTPSPGFAPAARALSAMKQAAV